MKYKIIADTTKQKSFKYVEELKSLLRDWEYSESKIDYLFIIGGDGTFLHNAIKYINDPIKIVFINSGTLGFYSCANSIKDLDLELVKGNKHYTTLDLIEVKHSKNKWYCINDFSFNSTYAIEIDILVNNILLEKMKGNGVLVTTPMGSTARNKSLGGAIIMPELPVFSIVEIEPIHNRHYSSLGSPIVVSNKNEIIIQSKKYDKYSLIVDGMVYESTLDEPIHLKHVKSKAKILIKNNDKDWINKLNYSFK